MTSAPLESYLRRLGCELTKRGLPNARIVEEAREHLADAIEAGLQRGLSIDAAEGEAFVRFGAPELLAAQFAAERVDMWGRLFVVLARLAGWSRSPEPRPAAYHVRDVAPRPVRLRVSLKRWARRRFRKMSPDERAQVIARMKERGEDTSVFESDPREHLRQFLGTFGPRTFGPGVALESLTLLEDTHDSSTRGGKYVATFTGGARMIWTVAHAMDGSSTFLEGIHST